MRKFNHKTSISWEIFGSITSIVPVPPVDSDAAGNLKNQIDAANEKIKTNASAISNSQTAINMLNEGLTVKDITSKLRAPSGINLVYRIDRKE